MIAILYENDFGQGGRKLNILPNSYGNIESSFNENDLDLNKLITDSVPRFGY